MTISQVNASSDVSVSAYANPQGLTAESLVIFLNAKLQSIDGSLDAFMRDQQENISRKEQWQKYREMLSNIKHADGDQDKIDTIRDGYFDSLDRLPPGSVAQQEASAIRADWDANVKQQSTKEEWMDVDITRVDDKISSFDKGMELTMIRINQLMAQRQTAVQLASNIMKKHEDGISAIVQNLR